MPYKRIILVGLFLLFVFIQLQCQSWWNKELGAYLNPAVLLFSGLASCFLAYFLVGFKPNSTSKFNRQDLPICNIFIVILFFSIGTFFVGNYYAYIHSKYVVEIGYGSDIIPALQLYVRRFLAGELVYAPMQIEGYIVYPNYFSMAWLPYCFSELLNIDYRWTAYIVFLIPIFIYLLQMAWSPIHPFELAIKTLIPFAMLYSLMLYGNDIFGYSVELMLIGLYLLLALSLMHRSTFIMAAGIVIVLLSRYSFSFWLPVYLLIIWMERGFKDVFKVSLWVLFGILVLYVIPFLSKDWESMSRGFAYYNQFIEDSWTIFLNDAEKPFMLLTGYSMAIYIFDFLDGELIQRLNIARFFQIAISLLTAVLVFLNYYRNRNKGLNVKIYLLITLTLYLFVFYGFFMTPFRYLYHLPLLLCIPILYQIPFFTSVKNNTKEKLTRQ